MKILHIDDDHEVTDALCNVLNQKNIECTSANQGKKGLELILNNQYDFVFLDLVMPLFSGFDVIKNLVEKKHDLSNIIIITANNLSQQIQATLEEYNVHSIVKKPISASLIQEILKEKSVLKN